MKTILSSCSARPNFVKLASVHHALAKKRDVRHLILHTGQHYDPLLSDIFFTELGIPQPTVNLGIRGATQKEVIDATAAGALTAIKELKPDMVLVYGDVNGAVGVARAAKEAGIALGHVESGLRSFDTEMPEELNRIEIDTMADHLFVTEKSGLDHLKKEKVKGEVHFVGNTMIDTLIRMMPTIEKQALPAGLPPTFGVVTLHRPSNVDTKEALERNLKFLNELSESIPLVLPLHRRTKGSIESFGLQNLLTKNIHVIDPLGYIEFLALVRASAFILTDSGGIQEEATLLKKRCFTVRLNTERPSTIVSGSNILIDLTREEDRAKVLVFAKKPKDPVVVIPELWDGKAGERIAEIVTSV